MSDTTVTIIVAFIVLLVLLIAAGVAIPLWLLRKKKKRTEDLLTSGIKGEATIMDLNNSGTHDSDISRVNMLLEVRIPDHPPYQIRKSVTVPLVRLSQLQQGTVVSVLVDPNQPQNPEKVGILLR